MNILIISKSFLINEGLEPILNTISNFCDIKHLNSLLKCAKEDFINLDFLFIDMTNEKIEDLNIVQKYKKILKNMRVMVFDPNKKQEIFESVVSIGIEGYVSEICDKDEFIYIVKNVSKGKKIYSTDLIEYIADKSLSIGNTLLTNREKQVMELVSKGLNNKAIAENMYITEYTVKKHVSNILTKMHLKNRKEIILLKRVN